MDKVVTGIIVGVAIGSVLAVAVMIEGRSGKSLLDYAEEWCRNHLQW